MQNQPASEEGQPGRRRRSSGLRQVLAAQRDARRDAQVPWQSRTLGVL